MQISRRRALFAGIALLVCSAVLLKTALTRLSIVLFGAHAGFAVSTLPFFGLALGAIFAFALPALIRPPRVLSSLAYLSSAAAFTSVVVIIVLIQPIWVNALTQPSPRLLLIPWLTALIPFLIVGIALAGVLRHASPNAGQLGFATLIGLAFGEVGASTVPAVGGGRIGLVAAIVASAASFSFVAANLASKDIAKRAETPFSLSIVSTFALGVCVVLAGDIGAPWLKLTSLRWTRVDRAELVHWGARALITVEKPTSSTATLYTDAAASEWILAATKTPDPLPSEMAYTLHQGQGIPLIIGPGAGAEIKRALKAGHKEVHAVEPDLVISDLVMRNKYAEFSGNLYNRPDVQVVFAEPRSFIRRIPQPYRAVVLPLPNIAAPLSAGAMTLNETPWLTVEAFHDYIERLTPDGTLVVTRFDTEFERLFSTAAVALRGRGVENPGDHLFACSFNSITSLLTKKSPIKKDELAILRATCRRGRYTEAYAPDQTRTEPFARILSISSAKARPPAADIDLSPPTDDRPYFNFQIPPHQVPRALLHPLETAPKNEGVFVLAVSVMGALLFALALFLIPILGNPTRLIRAPDRGFSLSLLMFSLFLGAGLTLGQGALTHQTAAFIDHPVNGYTVAAIVLFVFAAIGSLTADHIPLAWLALVAGRRAQLLTALVSVYAVAQTTASALWIRHVAPLPLIARFAIAVLPLLPLGLLAGSLAPLGMRLMSARAPQLLPWCFALLAAGAAFGIAFAKVLAIHLGESALMFAAGLACLIASALLPPLMVRTR